MKIALTPTEMPAAPPFTFSSRIEPIVGRYFVSQNSSYWAVLTVDRRVASEEPKRVFCESAKEVSAVTCSTRVIRCPKLEMYEASDP